MEAVTACACTRTFAKKPLHGWHSHTAYMDGDYVVAGVAGWPGVEERGLGRMSRAKRAE